MEELIKQLREPCQYENCVLCQQAADAIEELQKACEDAYNKGLLEGGIAQRAEDEKWLPKWIPVTERLPEEAGRYLVCGRWRGKQTEIWVCEFMLLGCLKGWVNNAANPCVSHWMPIPEPPKEETC